MGEVITIGLDIVKSVFQVHGVDDAGAGSDPQACQLGENVILLAEKCVALPQWLFGLGTREALISRDGRAA
jgi:hypothetical protein